MLLCALVLLSCVNGVVAVDSELESQSWANETSDSVTAETSISDGFSSTADWLKGKGMSAYSKAKSAANYSQSILESSTKKFSDEMLVAYRRGGDAAVISASGIWRNTFPLCIELGSVVRLKVNGTLDRQLKTCSNSKHAQRTSAVQSVSPTLRIKLLTRYSMRCGDHSRSLLEARLLS